MLDHKLKRRTLLRMLAASCVMSIPMVSRARQSDAGRSSGMLAAQDGPGTPASAKISKAQAKYQAQPKAGQMCVNCANFIPSSSCKLVEGKVSPNGWCTLWARKQA